MILITDSQKEIRCAYAEMFHYMGILSRTCEPKEVLRAVTGECSAVLYTSLSGREGEEEAVLEQRTLCGLPFFAITDYPCEAFDLTFPVDTLSSTVAREIARHQEDAGLRPIGSYLALGINASVDAAEVNYLGEPLELTKTEKMIIRYLVRAYPNPVSAQDVLRHAFRQTRLPEISSVRTHISIINKKFKGAFGMALASVENGQGYVISLRDNGASVGAEPLLLYS